MPIPPFLADLRRQVGHALLWLPGVTVVVLRPGARGAGPEVLLTLRSDLEVWAPVAGILEPGEEPQVTAVREAREEAGVEVEVEQLVSVSATDEITYPNGDRCAYLDVTVRARWVAGAARVNDDESLEVRWWPADALPDDMRALDRQRVLAALGAPSPALLGRDALAAAAGEEHGESAGEEPR